MQVTTTSGFAENQVGRCVCNAGFVGFGNDCQSAEICNLECFGDGLSCVVQDGQPLCASMEVHNLQNLVTKKFSISSHCYHYHFSLLSSLG